MLPRRTRGTQPSGPDPIATEAAPVGTGRAARNDRSGDRNEQDFPTTPRMH